MASPSVHSFSVMKNGDLFLDLSEAANVYNDFEGSFLIMQALLAFKRVGKKIPSITASDAFSVLRA